MATPTPLPELLHRREHRLGLNLTAAEIAVVDQIAAQAGARTRASIARALLFEAIEQRQAAA